MYSKILVPMALTHGVSSQTLEIAKALCSAGGEIIALHVHEELHGTVSAYLDKKAVKAGFDSAKAVLVEKASIVPEATTVMVSGHSGRTVLEYAKKHDIDCIVMGSHKPGLRDYFLGSTAGHVVRHAHCAVHVHRHPD
ncbi:UspA domain-containing protein [Sulfitobacter noctilucicola]|uniref:Nucleotide-binding universal stress UspA family protein n=1 Tax=Sulfitobacter noctilucicola TaxID=1342301 RepID=A0A7W6Q6N1_9RHOB|nr:universal stress protein [Sulfitobacter noctilucicola]KIN63520.1 UspA domain-containing protein [Sulfitobacter noctilucicola]MBB4174970.1 nucleotide-binding universal stress UspA family protein [Sulfitobacter noctilucicola]